MRGFVTRLVMGMLLSGPSSAAMARPQDRDQRFRQWMTVAGAGVGLILDIFYLFSLHTGYQSGGPPLLVPTIVTLASLVQAGTAAIAGRLLAEYVIQCRPGLIAATLSGPVYGAIVGAVSFGLTLGGILAIAIPTGAIRVDPDAAFMGYAQTWYDGLWVGVRGGAMFGAMWGAAIGFVATPVADLIYRRKRQE